MDRRLSIFVLAGFLALTGCKSSSQTPQTNAYDPFLGRTTVPPPGTMAPVAPQPFFQTPQFNQQAAPPIAAPITPGQPATPAAQTPQNYAPPGHYLPQSSVSGISTQQLASQSLEPIVTIDLDAMAAGQPSVLHLSSADVFGSDATQVGSVPSGIRLASNESPVQVRDPEIAAAGRLLKAESTAPAQHSAPSFQAKATPLGAASIEPNRFQPPVGSMTTFANQTEPSTLAQYQRTRPEVSLDFDYDRQYRWLKGRLEYLESKQLWQLRYISLNDESDQYGGSVALVNPPDAIQQFKAGDFVVVYGQVVSEQDTATSFAPLYKVNQIQAQ